MSGEFELIAALRARIEAAGAGDSTELVLGSGDDAAITVPGGATATSVDALVEGVHFRMPPFTAHQVGHKALAAALSDLAAMGAAAGEAYVQLGVPDDIDDVQLLELAEGMAALAARTATAIAGGDVTRSPALLVAVTAVGHAAAPERFVRRAGARPGDAVVITGELGGAAAGLALLARPELAADLAPGLADALRARQVEPEPRLAAGRELAAAGATAMIDVSDGLGADARHLASAGGVALELDLDSLPIQAGVAELAAAAGLDPLELATAGGEDYELLATLPPGAVEQARDALAGGGSNLSVVGAVAGGDGVTLSGAGRAWPVAGFDQLGHRRVPGDPA